LALAEGKTSITKRRFKIIGWVVYILGVPAWAKILLLKKDWIVASIEFGGIPAMLFGLYNIYKNTKYPNKVLDIIASLFTCASILLGSYFMAKNKSYGWI